MPIACLCHRRARRDRGRLGRAAAEARRMPALALGGDRRRSSCSPTCTSAPSIPRRPTGPTAPTRPCGRAPEGRLVEVPVFRPTSTTAASTSTTSSGCCASGRSATRRRHRRRPTWSPATSSPSTAATGRRALPTASGSSRPRRSPCTEASTSTTRSSRIQPGWPGGGSSPTGGARSRPTARSRPSCAAGRARRPPSLSRRATTRSSAQAGSRQDELGHQMSSSHATLWVYGGGLLSLFLGSPEPLTVRIEVDGRPRSTHVLRKLLPEGPTRVGAHRRTLAPRRARNGPPADRPRQAPRRPHHRLRASVTVPGVSVPRPCRWRSPGTSGSRPVTCSLPCSGSAGAPRSATYAILTTRQGNPAEMASMARKAGLIGERFYTPLSLLVLAFGFGLMENDQSPWTYDQFFVDLRARRVGRLPRDRSVLPRARGEEARHS